MTYATQPKGIISSATLNFLQMLKGEVFSGLCVFPLGVPLFFFGCILTFEKPLGKDGQTPIGVGSSILESALLISSWPSL